MIYLDKALSNFLEAVDSSLGQQVTRDITEPHAPGGVWVIDLYTEDYGLVVQYSERLGFGISANPTEFGDAPDERFSSEFDAARRSAELFRTLGRTMPRATLSELRGAKTQSQVAHSMDIKQPSYAKMEGANLATLKVDTLAKVVCAMEAKLHLVVERAGQFFILQDKSDVLYERTRCASQSSQYFHGAPLGLVALDPSIETVRLAHQHVVNIQSGNVLVGEFRKGTPQKVHMPLKQKRDQGKPLKPVGSRRRPSLHRSSDLVHD